MNYIGILIGLLSLLIIGVWHPIVIKGEYYLGKKSCIPLFVLAGTGCTVMSLAVSSVVVSVSLAMFGFSAFWGVKEVIEQEERVKKGWFPENPQRKGSITQETRTEI